MTPLWALCVILDHYQPTPAVCFPAVASVTDCARESAQWHQEALSWSIRSGLDPTGPMALCGPVKASGEGKRS